METVALTKSGTARVLNGVPGMTFPVVSESRRISDNKRIVVVADFRYPKTEEGGRLPFQPWSLGPDDYEPVILDWEYQTPYGWRQKSPRERFLLSTRKL